ncbi:hypothetical protein EYZ11_004429 [Aspergillus tanneri]|uniref:Uncharacterized protein n=1 Tax=Aspergillus tanneri TaxID=1220188 RepID=A0A4S3JMY7_9EURO|nr:hypothetical protein EYZ11_004429 [Aspergillus tanneri]
MSPVNPYASEPAVPVLAHSLLPQSPSAHRDKSQTWNLRDDLDVGFQSPNRTFRSGIVIGISTLRSKDNNNDDDEYVGRLPRSLLAGRIYLPWIAKRQSPVWTLSSSSPCLTLLQLRRHSRKYQMLYIDIEKNSAKNPTIIKIRIRIMSIRQYPQITLIPRHYSSLLA